MTDELSRQRARIVHDREELGRTVQALAGKVDVPARTREAAAAARESARMKVQSLVRGISPTDVVLAATGLVASWVALGCLTDWWRRR